MSKNESNKTIKGDVFIVPNKSVKGCEFILKDKVKNEMETLFPSYIKDFDNEKFVEVWCMTPGDGESNWACHGFDNNDDEKLSSNWPVYNGHGIKRMVTRLPYELLKDKKEGDIIKFSFEDVEFELTACQLKHRYQNHGTFERVLERVTF